MMARTFLVLSIVYFLSVCCWIIGDAVYDWIGESKSRDDSIAKDEASRRENDAFSARKDRLIAACRSDGGTVALGFGFSVVCIDGQVAKETRP